jgi:structural maintenance of chromosome 1
VGKRKLSKLTSRRYTFSGWGVFYVLTVFRKLEGKLATLQGDLKGSKQEYDNPQSERTRIRYLASSNPPCRSIYPLSYSRLETETNEKLADVYQLLLQAGVDRNESQREAKLKETFSSLQCIFPGGSCQQAKLSSY